MNSGSGHDGLSSHAPPSAHRDVSTRDESADAEVSLTGRIPTDMYFPIVAFTCIALYNVIELTCIIFSTFKKRSGLYFTSFCVATWGIPPYAIAYLVLGQRPRSHGIYGYAVTIVVGWAAMVTGQSLVLYSRLHLIDRDRRHLRAVLAMIVTNGIVLHSVTAALAFGANSTANPARFYRPYSIMEKVQVTIFFVQESVLSVLYIWATARFFQDSALHAASTRARMLRQLIAVNVVLLVVDATILGLEFADLYKLQTSYKAMAYSIKLKLEFRILNQLVGLARGHAAWRSHRSYTQECVDERLPWDSAASPSHPSGTFNTVFTGSTQERRGTPAFGNWGGFSVATCFSCGERGSTAEGAPAGDGGIMRTTDISVSRDDEPEPHVETRGRTNTDVDRRSVDITATRRSKNDRNIKIT